MESSLLKTTHARLCVRYKGENCVSVFYKYTNNRNAAEMPADTQKLLSAEDSVKQKHLDIVKQMSVDELKKFNTGKQFKQNLLDELTALLPGYATARLTETAQCISNAVYREAKSLLNKKQRNPQTNKTIIDEHLLSDTIIQDLDTTMQPGVDSGNACYQPSESEATETDDCDDDNHSANQTSLRMTVSQN